MKVEAIIFDLDKTIWNCYKKNSSKQIWAKQLVPPFKLLSPNCIEDSIGQKCFLHHDFKNFLNRVYGNYKLGFLSVGALKDEKYDKQPSILLLKKFEIYEYFNYEKYLLWKDESKYEKLKNMCTCAFIDDDKKHTDPAHKLDNVFVIERDYFKNWGSLIDDFKRN